MNRNAFTLFIRKNKTKTPGVDVNNANINNKQKDQLVNTIELLLHLHVMQIKTFFIIFYFLKYLLALIGR